MTAQTTLDRTPTSAVAAAALAKTHEAPTYTRKEMLSFALEALVANPDKVYHTVHRIEDMDQAAIDRTPIAGTVFGAMAAALGERGVSVGGTMGDVQRTLGLSPEDLHAMACFCHEGNEKMSARWAVPHLQSLVDQA